MHIVYKLAIAVWVTDATVLREVVDSIDFFTCCLKLAVDLRLSFHSIYGTRQDFDFP